MPEKKVKVVVADRDGRGMEVINMAAAMKDGCPVDIVVELEEADVMIDISGKQSCMNMTHFTAAAARGMAIVSATEGMTDEQMKIVHRLSLDVPIMTIAGRPMNALDAAFCVVTYGPKAPGIYSYRHWR